jgi:hypothetical protein
MHENFSCILPKNSFVDFYALEVRYPQVLWKNKKYVHQKLNSYHFVPHAHDDLNAHLNSKFLYSAERYGGYGVGKNGGAARCGNVGQLQVKGIGRTPLAGSSADFLHSHGGATVLEAVEEAIWSEICNCVLPFGAVRVSEIVSTSTLTFEKTETGLAKVPRALIVREQAIRPAHFLRAENFDPNDLVWRNICSDTNRTKSAVEVFDIAVNSIFRIPTKRWDFDTVNESLLNCVKRYAFQIARSRARRIVHGSLNCSNIALDGRYIDFGTMTSIDDYGRVIISGARSHIWSEQENLKTTLSSMLFFIRKFCPVNASNLISEKNLLREFDEEIKVALCLEFIMLCGFTPAELSRASQGSLIKLWSIFDQIIKSGNNEPFRLSGRISYPHGDYGLNEILLNATLSENKAALQDMLSTTMPTEMCMQLSDAYWQLRNEILGEHPTKRRLLQLISSSFRLNGDLNYLEKSVIANCVRNSPISVGSYINETVESAQKQLATPNTDESPATFTDLSNYSRKYGRSFERRLEHVYK